MAVKKEERKTQVGDFEEGGPGDFEGGGLSTIQRV